MPPKKEKKQKMALSDFLGDEALGSWADEMDSLPTAPSGEGNAPRGGRDDFLSSRGDRGDRAFPPREDLPLPSAPPYTAFVGNMAFDCTEDDLGAFFDGLSVKNVKVIKDRDERPKGFGYVEFATLEDLKGALEKSSTPLAGRTVRISVAEPPKGRDGGSGFGGGAGGGFDDAKFDSDWRNSKPGPLPPARGNSGFGMGGGGFDRGDRPPREPLPPSVADSADAWRSSRPARAAPEPAMERKRPGVGIASLGAADTEETWSKGSRFQPSEEPPRRGGFGGERGGFGGGFRQREEPPSAADAGEWRRPGLSRQGSSPTTSTPPTPLVGARRPLNLLPRGQSSGGPSPLGSPQLPSAKASPFGAAKPVDVSAREAAVAEKLEQRAAATAGHPMSRTGSRAGSQRGTSRLAASASTESTGAQGGGSPRVAAASPKPEGKPVRAGFSFAAAAGKEDKDVEGAAQGLSEVSI